MVKAGHPEVVHGTVRRRLPEEPRIADSLRQRHPLTNGTILDDELTATLMMMMMMLLLLVMLMMMMMSPADVEPFFLDPR